jgi:hypothetical protein
VAVLAIACLLVLLMQGCDHDHGVEPQSFQSPDDAVQTLTNALRADDTDQSITRNP